VSGCPAEEPEKMFLNFVASDPATNWVDFSAVILPHPEFRSARNGLFAALVCGKAIVFATSKL
jgi:hypothetical protein